MRLKGEIVRIDRSKILRIPFSNDIPGFVGLSKRVIHDDSCYECLSFTLRMKSESRWDGSVIFTMESSLFYA